MGDRMEELNVVLNLSILSTGFLPDEPCGLREPLSLISLPVKSYNTAPGGEGPENKQGRNHVAWLTFGKCLNMSYFILHSSGFKKYIF